MAKGRSRQRVSEESEAIEESGTSSLQRLSRALREHPVTALAVGAGVGALMGAELLAAGLAGGAAILLLQRSDLRERARHFVDEARDRISDEGGHSTAHHA